MKKLLGLLMLLNVGFLSAFSAPLSVKITKPVQDSNHQAVIISGKSAPFEAVVSGNQGGPYICYHWDFGGDDLALPGHKESKLGDLNGTTNSVMVTFLPAAEGQIIPVSVNIKDQCRNHASAELQVMVPKIEFTPDPATHVDSSKLTILTADVERLNIKVKPTELYKRIVYKIKNPNTAKFVKDPFTSNAKLDSIHKAEAEEEALDVIGLKVGETLMEAHLDSPSGPIIKTIPVLVGGTIEFAFNQPATYFHQDGGTQDAKNRGGLGSIILGGSAIQSGNSDTRKAIPDDVEKKTKAIPLIRANVQIRVLDKAGNPKMGKKVAIVPERKILSTVPNTDGGGGSSNLLEATNQGGISSGTLGVSAPKDSLVLHAGMDHENIAIVVGRVVDVAGENVEVSKSQRTSSLITKHSNDFKTLTYKGSLEAGNPTITSKSLIFPLVSHAQYLVIKQGLEGGIYEDSTEISGGVSYSKYRNGNSEPVDASIPRTKHIFEVPTLVNDVVVPHAKTELQTKDIDIKPGKIIATGAIAAELAISMVPGGDFIDVCKEFFWKPVINNEPVIPW